jgi:hypothetical protein
MKFASYLALIVAALPLAVAARSPAPDPVLTPIVADTMYPPQAVPGSDGRLHLVYELGLANVAPAVAEFLKVEVLDAGSGDTLLTMEREEIGRRLSIGGRRGAESSDLGAGQIAVMFIHVALDAERAAPAAIVHRLTLRVMLGEPIDIVETAGGTEVDGRPPPVLGPPLAGGGYVAADGCCDSVRHIRALLPLNGRFTLAQRFAIDWEQVDDENRLFRGDRHVPESYTIYGREVLAVADGTVVASRNDLPEQIPGALPVDLPLSEVDGNFVVLDIGGGVHVLYAHLQPGSVLVSAGTPVKRGDIIGRVGNTGSSQVPHLHLHVMDGPSPLLSNGIPYVFDSFTVTAINRAGTADLEAAEATGRPMALTPLSPRQRFHKVLPLDLSIVEFSR